MLEGHHGGLRHPRPAAGLPERLQLGGRVGVAPRRTFPAARSARPASARAALAASAPPAGCPRERQVAELGEQLLEPQRRADGDGPGERLDGLRVRRARACRCAWAASATTCSPSGKPGAGRLEGQLVRARSAPRCRASPGRASAGPGRAPRRPARERVSSIGVEGSIVAPGAGLTSASSLDPAGNQLTRSGADSFSHGRAAVETTSTPKRFGPVAWTPGLNDLPRLRELEALLLVARQLEHDDARRRPEVDVDRGARGEVEERAANAGRRRDDRRLDLLVPADEPADERGAAHGHA